MGQEKYRTLEEINGQAQRLRQAGDTKALYELAEDCGLEKSDVEDYLADVGDFATPLMAAVGRLKQEGKRLKLEGGLLDWLETVMDMACDDEALQAAILEKSLCGLFSRLLQTAFEGKVRVSDEIVNQTKVRVGGDLKPLQIPLYMGCPNRRQVKKTVTDYYLGGGE